MLSELLKNQRNLMFAGLAFAVLCLILMILLFVDSTQILGINRWIKPLKFASSISIYAFTLAVYLQYLDSFEWSKKIIGNSIIWLMVGEMFLIILQASRGTTSHFNISTAFDGLVFAAMGIMITINTFLIIYLTYLYWKSDFSLPKTVVWGMKFGLVLFIFGSLLGGYMSSQVGHSVGVADGGTGLPFVNWSTIGGDLRVAHFFGLHAIQIVPIFAILLEKFRLKSSVIIVSAFALIYFAFISFTFIQALFRVPFLKL